MLSCLRNTTVRLQLLRGAFGAVGAQAAQAAWGRRVFPACSFSILTQRSGMIQKKTFILLRMLVNQKDAGEPSVS